MDFSGQGCRICPREAAANENEKEYQLLESPSLIIEVKVWEQCSVRRGVCIMGKGAEEENVLFVPLYFSLC